MLEQKEARILFVFPKSAFRKPTAGANMLGTSSETKVMRLTRLSKTHFFLDEELGGI